MESNGNKVNPILNQNQDNLILKDDFIGYINALSDSIKEYWKVTMNVNKNKSYLINTLEKEVNSPDIDLSSIANNIYQLKLEIESSINNISLFSEDMKILFKKMKEKQIELKTNISQKAQPQKYNNNDNIGNQQYEDLKKLKDLEIENKKLKNKHELEILKITESNKNLSLKLINLQNELTNIQKENITKSQEIESLKLSIKSHEGEERKSLINSIKSIVEDNDSTIYNQNINNLSESFNKILERYKNENEQLKLNQKNFQEKIREVNNINQDISSRLQIMQNLYNNLMTEKKELIDKIVAKDIKIIKLEFENSKYKNEIDNLNNIKLSTGIIDDDKNESEIKTKLIQLNKKLKQEKQEGEKLKEELTKIKNEKEKYQQKLLVLGIDYKDEHEIKINRDDIIEKLSNENEKLKEKNKTLSEAFETLCSQSWNNISYS